MFMLAMVILGGGLLAYGRFQLVEKLLIKILNERYSENDKNVNNIR